MASFSKAQAIVGISEGGYQDNPRDTGNYFGGVLIGTNWGISAPTLATYLGRTPTRAEMVNLSRETAMKILKQRYWLRHNLHLLKNQSVATLIYDGIVNHGSNSMRFLVAKALKPLNRHIEYYNAFTEKGIKVLNSVRQKSLFYRIKSARKYKYKSIGNKEFQAGWFRRLDRIKYFPTWSFSRIMPYVAVASIVVAVLLIQLP